jgi:hypothetical protein
MIFSKRDLIFIFTTSALMSLGFTAYFTFHYDYFSYFVALLNIIFLIKFYNNIIIFILFGFILFYTITFYQYFVNSLYISYWDDFQNINVVKRVLLSHSLFIFTLGNLTSTKKAVFNFNFRENFRSNKILFYGFFIICILLLIFGIQGQSLLNGSSYANQEFTSKSTLHEYFILFYLFLILFSSQNKFEKIVIKVLFIIYVLKTLIYGGRVEVLEIFLLWFLLFFLNKIKLQTVLFFVLIGLYGSNVVSNIRSNPIQFLSGNDLGYYFDPLFLFDHKSKYDIISSNEGDVIQSSARILGLIDNEHLSFSQRIISSVLYFISPVVPASFMPSYSNLSTYKQDIYRSGGGGLISIYFYAWYWYFGPVIIAIFLAFFINKFFLSSSLYYYIYGVAIFTTFPRWFAYNPIMLVKFCLYAVIILFVLNKFFVIKKSTFQAQRIT